MLWGAVSAQAQTVRGPEPQIDDVVSIIEGVRDFAPGLPVRIVGHGFADEAAQAAGAPGVSRLQNASVEFLDGETWFLCRLAAVSPTEIIAILPADLKVTGGRVRVVSGGVASRPVQISLLRSAIRALVRNGGERITITDLRRDKIDAYPSALPLGRATLVIFGLESCLSEAGPRAQADNISPSNVSIELDNVGLTIQRIWRSDALPGAVEIDIAVPELPQDSGHRLLIRAGTCESLWDVPLDTPHPTLAASGAPLPTPLSVPQSSEPPRQEVASPATAPVKHSAAATAGGVAGGTDGQIQYNCSGALCGDTGMVWDAINRIFYLRGANPQTQPYLWIRNNLGGNVYYISGGGIHFITPYADNTSSWHLNDAAGNYKVAGGTMLSKNGWLAVYNAKQTKVVQLSDVSQGGNLITFDSGGYRNGAVYGNEWRSYSGGAGTAMRARYGPSGAILGAAATVQWRNQLDPSGGASDLALRRDAPGILAVDSGTAGTGGGLKIPALRSITGTRFVCVDASGVLSSSTTPCSGT